MGIRAYFALFWVVLGLLGILCWAIGDFLGFFGWFFVIFGEVWLFMLWFWWFACFRGFGDFGFRGFGCGLGCSVRVFSLGDLLWCFGLVGLLWIEVLVWTDLGLVDYLFVVCFALLLSFSLCFVGYV